MGCIKTQEATLNSKHKLIIEFYNTSTWLILIKFAIDVFSLAGSMADDISNNNTMSEPNTQLFPRVNDQVTGVLGEEDAKVVDEIESLCMNCHDDVSIWKMLLL